MQLGSQYKSQETIFHHFFKTIQMRLLQRDILDRIEGEDSIENISSKLFQLGHENDVYDKFIELNLINLIN